ncbi:hypothetical protein CR513_61848, partial [Mucuna pruriens]
ILRDHFQGILRLLQENYISKVLDRFGLKDSKLGNTLIAKGDKFSLKQCPNNDLKRNKMQKIPYASIMFTLVPDIAFVVGVLGKYLSDPEMQHWKIVKRVMRLEIIGYFDSDLLDLKIANALRLNTSTCWLEEHAG